MQQASFACPQCQQRRLFQAERMNHVAHLLASVFLCGLWAPIWAIMAMSHNPEWHCAFCGFHDLQQYLVNPHLREHEMAARAQRAAEADARREMLPEMSFGQRSAYWVSENKGLILGLVVATAFVGTMITLVLVNTRLENAAATQAANTIAADTIVANRRAAAITFERELAKRYKGVVAATEGSKAETLLITIQDLNESHFRAISKDAKLLRDMKDAGFSTLRLNGPKSGGWSLSL